MKTLVFKISPSDNDKETIKSLQKDYSISFRKLYNNFDEIKTYDELYPGNELILNDIINKQI